MSDTDPILLAQSLKQRAIDFRTRVLAGDALSEDEVRDALACIRQFRKLGAVKQTKPTTPARDAVSLMSLFSKKPDNNSSST